MLYLKTERLDLNIETVSCIGESYTLHWKGSSLFEHMVSEEEIHPEKTLAVLTSERETRVLGSGFYYSHSIVQGDGSELKSI